MAIWGIENPIDSLRFIGSDHSGNLEIPEAGKGECALLQSLDLAASGSNEWQLGPHS